MWRRLRWDRRTLSKNVLWTFFTAASVHRDNIRQKCELTTENSLNNSCIQKAQISSRQYRCYYVFERRKYKVKKENKTNFVFIFDKEKRHNKGAHESESDLTIFSKNSRNNFSRIEGTRKRSQKTISQRLETFNFCFVSLFKK